MTIKFNGTEIRKVLVKLPNYVGDLIMCLPSLFALRKHLLVDDCVIELLTERRMISLLHKQACYDRLIDPEWDPHKVTSEEIVEYLTKEQMKGEKYDLVISFTRQQRFLRAFMQLGIPIRIGYSAFMADRYLTAKLIHIKGHKQGSEPQKQVEYYLDLVRLLTSKKLEHESKQYMLTSNDKDWIEAKRNIVASMRLSAISVHTEKPQPEEVTSKFFVVAVSTADSKHGRNKRWPLWNFVKTAKLLCAEKVLPQMSPVFVFDPKDTKLFEEIQPLLKYVNKGEIAVIEPGHISLGQLMAMIEKSEFVVCNDSGPRHISAAIKTKVISIMGPTSLNRTNFSFEYEYPVWVNVGCNLIGCTVNRCAENNTCMTSVTPKMVCQAVKQFVYGLN
ncbi:MAG: hypothetical protein K9N55_10215 [Phycisphaerae bacterium]|nr:hypothetical protein [Phycisphaerae bacterium]